MKDARGHGSDPRGAHSQGVDQIGKVETRPISSVHPTQDVFLDPTKNPYLDPVKAAQINKRDQAVVDGMRATIRSGGYLPPLTVARNGDLLDGHHRLEAYQQEGIKQVPVSPQPTPPYAGIRRDIERIHGKQS